MKILWCVRIRDLGTDKPQKLFFKTQKEAQDFKNKRERADKPTPVKLKNEEAEKALMSTDFYLNPETF